jgi:hypothetical protein
MNADEAFARYIDLAASYEGCSAQTDPQRFGALCCPNGPDAARVFFCTPNVPLDANSSCEAVAAGLVSILLAELGRSELQGPFLSAVQSWADLMALAQRTGAVTSTIGAGCIIFVSSDAGRHVRTIVVDKGAGHYESIDGGGLDAQGYQCVKRAQVTIRGGTWDVGSSKPVVAVIDVRAMLTSLLGAS